MQRYKLILEYDGSLFYGWQKQSHLPSVQETLERAVFSFTHEEVEVYGAGRTDRGVHALYQVAHTDFSRPMSEHAIREAINFYVRDKGVVVLEVQKSPFSFHARFSAQKRGYMYRILQRPVPLVLDIHRAWQVKSPLDSHAMREAAAYLIGTHDFTTFRSADCQAQSPLRTLEEITLEEEKRSPYESEIRLYVRAKSFLHHQVRNMVGALKRVGEGTWTPLDLKQALEAKNRCRGGTMAPAAGLYLDSIVY